MILELPAYMMAIVHSSIDFRIHQHLKFLETIADPELREYMRNDDIPRLLGQIRAELERQAEAQGSVFKRIYTEKD